jgi:HlyD family secretion protein
MTAVTIDKTTPETNAKQATKGAPPSKLKHRSKANGLYRLLLILAVVAGGGWWIWAATHPKTNGAAGLITATAKRGNLIETVSATGSISSQTGTQVNIGSQITGRIKTLDVDVGTKVKAGQIIAVLDLPDIQAQLDQAKANLAAAQMKTTQDKSGVDMLNTQLTGAITQAVAGEKSGVAQLNATQAAADQQHEQTITDIQRAQNGVEAAAAALSTAKSNLAQVQAGVDLQVANAQQQINQAQANAKNSALNLTRQQALVQKGFVAQSIVDQAQATDTVNQSLILAAQQNLTLVQQKNTADLQSGRDTVTQAVQNLKIAQAALVAARAEKYLDATKVADVAVARAALNQAKANLVIAQGNVAQNVLKQQDVIQAQDATDAALQQVAYAKAQVDKTIIRSPIAGTVLQLAVQQGDTLAAGLSSPTLIVVADLNRLQVDAYVDETQISKVRLHQPVTFTVDAFSNQQFTGHVVKIASGSTIQQGVITYDVTIAFDKPQTQFKPDMTANVTIQTGQETNVVLVPAEAVKTGTTGTTVNVLNEKDGVFTAESRKVTIGGTDGVNTQIKDGLKEGETVILAGTIKAPPAKRSSSMFGFGSRGGGAR